MKSTHKTQREHVRIGKYLNEVVVVRDAAGNLLHKAVKPLMVELYPRDIVQMIVGATLLSVPVSFTEEVWTLGEVLPLLNIALLSFLTMVFIALFVYYNFYRHRFKQHYIEFIKRIVITYVISLLVSIIILSLLDKAPLGDQWMITIKRMILVSFPAAMSAAVADMIK